MYSKLNKEIDKKQGTSNYYDLTAEISEQTVIFPGDPEYKMQKICSLEKGNTFNLCHMQFGNHTGTHIDFPSHVIKNGKTSSDFSINHFIGTGLIIKVPDAEQSITKNFIAQQQIIQNDIVFFKTTNSNRNYSPLMSSSRTE